MSLIKGISYNFRGLSMGVKTPKLLLLGIIRIAVVILLTILAAMLIYYYLQANTEYHYRTVSEDERGRLIVSNDNTFTTQQ